MGLSLQSLACLAETLRYVAQQVSINKLHAEPMGPFFEKVLEAFNFKTYLAKGPT